MKSRMIFLKETLQALKSGAMVLVTAGILRAACGLAALCCAWAPARSLEILAGEAEGAAIEFLLRRGWTVSRRAL